MTEQLPPATRIQLILAKRGGRYGWIRKREWFAGAENDRRGIDDAVGTGFTQVVDSGGVGHAHLEVVERAHGIDRLPSDRESQDAYRHRWRGQEDVQVPVRLQTTPTQFGGSRWWFTCPLVVRGVACNRRVGKLHLPPGAKLFGCRQCHDLTYQSCQEAHQVERLVAWLGFPAELAPALAARFRGKG